MILVERDTTLERSIRFPLHPIDTNSQGTSIAVVEMA